MATTGAVVAGSATTAPADGGAGDGCVVALAVLLEALRLAAAAALLVELHACLHGVHHLQGGVRQRGEQSRSGARRHRQLICIARGAEDGSRSTDTDRVMHLKSKSCRGGKPMRSAVGSCVGARVQCAHGRMTCAYLWCEGLWAALQDALPLRHDCVLVLWLVDAVQAGAAIAVDACTGGPHGQGDWSHARSCSRRGGGAWHAGQAAV